MLTTVKGIYRNGKVTLIEPVPAVEQAEVLVTFSKELVPSSLSKPALKAGCGKGMIAYVAPDFNEPLEDLKDYM